MPDAKKRTATLAEAPAAKKRRTDKDAQKYYAVRAGVRPGVYLTWPECQKQINGFAGAQSLEIAPDEQDVQIFTDSQYSINCVTSWYKGWQKKDWHNSKGEPVKNRDLVEEVRELIETREAEGASTVFTWVKGHADNVGNTAADHLAVAGARMPPR
ncbi:ATP-binding cassette sub-family B member 5 [Verticillium dahliae VDG1]|nr:ATP-binding cassette sub-family B member 5 [Verticillium dahliae VDG1]